jgi:hypothetical protein
VANLVGTVLTPIVLRLPRTVYVGGNQLADRPGGGEPEPTPTQGQLWPRGQGTPL